MPSCSMDLARLIVYLCRCVCAVGDQYCTVRKGGVHMAGYKRCCLGGRGKQRQGVAEAGPLPWAEEHGRGGRGGTQAEGYATLVPDVEQSSNKKKFTCCLNVVSGALAGEVGARMTKQSPSCCFRLDLLTCTNGFIHLAFL